MTCRVWFPVRFREASVEKELGMRQSSRASFVCLVKPGVVSGFVLGAVFSLGMGSGFASGLQTAPKPKSLTAKPVPRPPVPARPSQPTARPSTAAMPNARIQPGQAPGARTQQPTTMTRPVQPTANGNRTSQPLTQPHASPRTEPHAEPRTEPRAEPRTEPHATSTGRPAETAKPRTSTEKTPVRNAATGSKETGRETGKEPADEAAINKPVHAMPHTTVKDSRGRVTAIKTSTGTEARINPKTGKITSLRKVGPDGAVTSVHTSPSGVRSVETVKKDSYGHPVRVVSHGGSGYQERDLMRRPGFKQRTYYDHGHTTVRVYQTVSYGRYGAYPVFVPDHYYHPGFYAYVGTPFPAPVMFSWGPNPGYAAYGPYFRPQPSYASPAAFIADFAIGANLGATAGGQPGMPGAGPEGGSGFGPGAGSGAGPGAGMNGGAGGDFPSPSGDPNASVDGAAQPEVTSGDPAPIPADVRDAYIQQVQGQIQAAQAQAGGKPQADAAPGALSPSFKVFQSYSDVEADLNGQQCALTGGDFVRREEDAPDSNSTVAVTVVTIAKPTASHCEANAKVRLPVATLQDWYNSYLESQQQGFAAMAANAGKNGFPPATDVATTVNPDGQGTPDDPHALAGALQQSQSDANAIQTEVQPGGGE